MRRSAYAALGALALLLSACYRPPVRGQVTRPSDSNMISIDAGTSELGRAYYLVDTKIGRCWFGTTWWASNGGGPSLSPLDCCELRDVTEAQAHLGFLSEAACTPAVTPAAPAAP